MITDILILKAKFYLLSNHFKVYYPSTCMYLMRYSSVKLENILLQVRLVGFLSPVRSPVYHVGTKTHKPQPEGLNCCLGG